MGHSDHRLPLLAVVVVGAILAAGCGGDGSDEAAATLEPGTGIDELAGVNTEDRCDLGFNTARFNETTELVHHLGEEHSRRGDVDFTLEEWADVFVDENLGMTAGQVVQALDADDIYRRHVLGGVLTHTLDPDPWMPMTDRAECDRLAGELREARAVTARYPTVADALADGYTLGDRHQAGLGVHYQNWNYLDAFVPDRPVQLLFDGTDDDSTLVGLSYVMSVPGVVPPEGFAGDNDHWHRHRSWCLDADNGGVNLGADVVGEEECVDLGGTYVLNTELWMLHVWVAPGCENDWGIFSGANPRLPYIPPGTPIVSGCNSGKTIADPLDLDQRGNGPDVN